MYTIYGRCNITHCLYNLHSSVVPSPPSQISSMDSTSGASPQSHRRRRTLASIFSSTKDNLHLPTFKRKSIAFSPKVRKEEGRKGGERGWERGRVGRREEMREGEREGKGGRKRGEGGREGGEWEKRGNERGREKGREEGRGGEGKK